jgi:hypothetical protein
VQGFEERLDEIRANVSSTEMFVKRFYRWFNAFMFLKYAHDACEKHYGRAPISALAADLARRLNSDCEVAHTADELLRLYRQLDRCS